MLTHATRAPAFWLALAASAGCAACRAAPSRSTEKAAHARRNASFVWHELVVSDLEAEVRFYEDVVGWRVRRDPDQHVTLLADFGEVAGVSRLPTDSRAKGVTPRWIGRVSVPDVDATVAKTRLHGGQVALEPIDLPDLRFAIVVDPGGAALQIATARELPAPVDHRRLLDFSWDELATPDGTGTIEFFGQTVGWKTLVVTPLAGKVEYITLGGDELVAAGVYADPALRDQRWLSYVQVADLDLVVSKAKRRGATVIAGPVGVPDGRMAQLRDPEGAVLGLREPARSGAR